MSSPRPTFDRPTLIRRDAATRYTWGDDQSGRVDDLIYASSGHIHQLLFSMSPGAWFRHSPQSRTIFGADETYTVLEGVLLLGNPESGEVHRLLAGDTAFFRKDTWHHGLCEGPGPVRVLEYMSPPPATGSSQAYARTRPYLELGDARYGEDRWLGRWPMAAAEAEVQRTMRVLGPRDVLWRIEEAAASAATIAHETAIVGLFAATQHLSAGRLRVPVGASTPTRQHAADVCFYACEGRLHAEAPVGATQGTLTPGDGLFIPGGTPYRLRNEGDGVAEALFGVGGAYP
jgi:quercetin dioxygenase-like cupin family protein